MINKDQGKRGSLSGSRCVSVLPSFEFLHVGVADRERTACASSIVRVHVQQATRYGRTKGGEEVWGECMGTVCIN